MLKSRQTITGLGVSASRSESAKKVLDTERRFIDDLMTPRVVMRIIALQNRFELRATLNIGGKGVAREILYRKRRDFFKSLAAREAT